MEKGGIDVMDFPSWDRKAVRQKFAVMLRHQGKMPWKDLDNQLLKAIIYNERRQPSRKSSSNQMLFLLTSYNFCHIYLYV